jgi:hypothetical protein
MHDVSIRRWQADEGRLDSDWAAHGEDRRAGILAVDRAMGGTPSAPLSLDVGSGEIVGLLFPRAKPRAPVLRALAGLDATGSPEVRLSGRGSIVVTTLGQPLIDALSAQPAVVLLDVAHDVADRNVWALLASERAFGTSFVVATSRVDQACRADRVSLASWTMGELVLTVTELLCEMTSRAQEFRAVVGERRRARTDALSAELRRLNVGSTALLAEMRRCARAGEETIALRVATARVAGVSVSDRVLDEFIAEAQDR